MFEQMVLHKNFTRANFKLNLKYISHEKKVESKNKAAYFWREER